jgi:hypothetical protein
MIVGFVPVLMVNLWLVVGVGYVAQGNQPVNASVKPVLAPCLQDNTVVAFDINLVGQDATTMAGNYTILTHLIDVAMKVVFHGLDNTTLLEKYNGAEDVLFFWAQHSCHSRECGGGSC